jgi:hypothetical protein
MFAKSTQVGLVALFAVATTALGGCAESVGSVPTTAATAYVSTPKAFDPKPFVKLETPALRPDSQVVASVQPVSNPRRREDCGR